jgi:hypothetical protein
MPMNRQTSPRPLATALAGMAIAASGCSHDAAAPAGKTDPGASSVAAPQPSALPSASAASASAAPAAASSKPPGSASPRPPPGPTAEQLADEARVHVAEAVRHAADKDACAAVLPLLDVSYSLTRGTVPVDEKELAVFADCAAAHQRWRLLRDLADAIAAGERKLETTYFLPRALIGQGSYEQANLLAKATLRAWPTEGAAYDMAALAAFRVKDWDGTIKAADQALLLLRKHNENSDVTALAHGLRGAALLRLGKTEEGVHEVGGAKGREGVLRVADITLDAAEATKKTGLLAAVELPDEAYPGLWPYYGKAVAPFGGLVTVVLQSGVDHPLPVLVEVAVDGAETAAESETVVKGKPVTLALTPALRAESPLLGLKAAEGRDVTVTVSGGLNHAVLYHETHKVRFEPPDSMPKVVRAHGEDLRSAFAITAAWVTPKAPSVVALVDAAKARLRGAKEFVGTKGPSLPQAQALWDELRSRGVAFHRDPRIDTEADESVHCRLPAEVLAAGSGDALESSVLFASLLEAIGLDVILVATPGHRMVGWVATAADLSASEVEGQTVKSPLGQAFFVETTTVGEGPFDAATLRGAAEWVAALNDGSVTSGRVTALSVPELRKRGVVARGAGEPARPEH